MINESISLITDRPEVTLTTYIVDNRSVLHDAFLIIPGEGYNAICGERAGEPIALWTTLADSWTKQVK